MVDKELRLLERREDWCGTLSVETDLLLFPPLPVPSIWKQDKMRYML